MAKGVTMPKIKGSSDSNPNEQCNKTNSSGVNEVDIQKKKGFFSKKIVTAHPYTPLRGAQG